MFARSAITAAAAGLALAAFGVPAATAAPAIPLNSGQEVDAGDVDAGEPGGHGFFTYSIEGTEFCWTLSWQNIGTPTAAHIHVGGRQVAGDVVIPLDDVDVPGPLDPSGCRTISADLAADITEDPGAFYVNVHNAEFPPGAIRGQLK